MILPADQNSISPCANWEVSKHTELELEPGLQSFFDQRKHSESGGCLCG